MLRNNTETELTIIVPVHNESKNLATLYLKVRDIMDVQDIIWEIIFVDDGSNDDSVHILEGVADEDDRVGVIRLARNFGQTAALMAGLDHASGEIIVPMDGDLQNDPTDIPRLIQKLGEGYDIVSGWRRDRKDHKIKVISSKIANRIISWISGVHLHDFGCSLKAYRRDILKGIRLHGEMHRFIPIYASWNGARVAEIEVNHLPRVYGRSKYGFERTIKVILDLIVLKFLAKYAQKPIYIFGGFGFLNLFISLVCFFLMLYYKYIHRTSFIQTPLPFLLSIFTLIGCMSILIGLLAELIMRTYFESQGKSIYHINYTKNITTRSCGRRREN